MERHQGHPQDDRTVGTPIRQPHPPAAASYRSRGIESVEGAAKLPLRFLPLRVWLLGALLAVAGTPAFAQQCPPTLERPQARGDGVGRFYLGREIAFVMGHQGADWLERPEREQEERPSLLLQALGVKAGDTIADIGAGTGYFAFRLAQMAPRGKVLAVDIQPEMLQKIRERARESGIRNVEPVRGSATDPGLAPASVDLVIMVDVYHEFSHPCEMIRAIARSLKPGGRVALVEYRAEDANVPIRPSHKMTRAQAEREMAVADLRLVKSVDSLPWQHLLIFEKR